LLSVVRRRRRQLGLGPEVFDELVGAAWIAIATFNRDRRPSSIAAALIDDADFHAFRKSRRRRSSDERPTDLFDDRASDEVPHASDELRELFALALASGVPQRDIELLRQLLAARQTIDVAAALDLTPRTIRNRRDRITDRLREVALAA
jgi:DNA-directed RNA polymerase specialized sigma24 family protein